ncbi:MAG: hypothetical protein K0M50_02835 [Prolixibacteraceae bacterium]|nr:hypothetical protein [Prolixibacteraceae bacterium]
MKWNNPLILTFAVYAAYYLINIIFDLIRNKFKDEAALSEMLTMEGGVKMVDVNPVIVNEDFFNKPLIVNEPTFDTGNIHTKPRDGMKISELSELFKMSDAKAVLLASQINFQEA